MKFVETNVMATVEILDEQPFFADISRSTRRDVMASLVRRNHLVSEKLGIDARRYYARKKLPPDRLPIEYASLKFCNQAGVRRLSRADIARLFPEFPPQLVSWPHPYFLHADADTTRLVQVRVEMSQRARTIVEKQTKAFRKKRKDHPGLEALVKNDRFSVVIIHGDRDLLFGAFENDPNSLASLIPRQSAYPSRVHLHHEPELLNFATYQARKAGRNEI